MKDHALGLMLGVDDPAARLNLLREYVQSFVLRSLHESEAFSCLAFVGGTALRFLEELPRFSEDLDFSLIKKEGYVPERWLRKIKLDLSASGFDCSVSWNPKRTVNSAWIRIGNLLDQAGLTTDKRRKLSIKLEIDTKPPAGAVVLHTVLTRHLIIAVRHYEIESLMAGKIHALITRPYPKGRDWYDLLWYCSKRPPLMPNLVLLQNALDQTQGKSTFDAARWSHYLQAILKELDTRALAQDVVAFLERPADRQLLTRENMERVLVQTQNQ